MKKNILKNSNHIIPVIFFFRRSENYFYSIENVFNRVIECLPDWIASEKYYLKRKEKGIFNRFLTLKDVFLNKGFINHITGHVTYLVLVLPKKKTIVTFHDLESIDRKSRIKKWILTLIWIKLPAKKCKIITTISEHTKDKIVKVARIKPEKVKVIYDPLPDGLTFTPKEFSTTKPNILVVGTKKNKNLEGIVKALESVKCRLTVIGKLSIKQVELLKNSNLDYENLFDLPYSEIIDVYKRCDILCFPSFYEGFGLPIIEAQAIGRPVITSYYGAMKEIAGDAALFVDPMKTEQISEAIVTLIHDRRLRDSLIQKGLENINRFEPKVIAEQYADLYDKITADSC